jgi:hypothetical protein
MFWETRLSNGEPGSMSRLSEPGSAKQEPTSAKSTEQLFHDAGGCYDQKRLIRIQQKKQLE